MDKVKKRPVGACVCVYVCLRASFGSSGVLLGPHFSFLGETSPSTTYYCPHYSVYTHTHTRRHTHLDR